MGSVFECKGCAEHCIIKVERYDGSCCPKLCPWSGRDDHSDGWRKIL